MFKNRVQIVIYCMLAAVVLKMMPERQNLVVVVVVVVYFLLLFFCAAVIPKIKPEGPQTITTGEALTLECIAEGAPDARVVWVPPPGSSVREVEGRGSAVIHVDPVTPDDAGVFTCYIYTEVETKEKTIEITGRQISVI